MNSIRRMQLCPIERASIVFGLSDLNPGFLARKLARFEPLVNVQEVCSQIGASLKEGARKFSRMVLVIYQDGTFQVSMA